MREKGVGTIVLDADANVYVPTVYVKVQGAFDAAGYIQIRYEGYHSRIDTTPPPTTSSLPARARCDRRDVDRGSATIEQYAVEWSANGPTTGRPFPTARST